MWANAHTVNCGPSTNTSRKNATCIRRRAGITGEDLERRIERSRDNATVPMPARH
jgi:hypothetical protein